MQNSKSFFMLIVMTAFFMGACAQKDSDFAEKYKENEMGAKTVDADATQAAGENAEAQNLKADIVDIKRVVSGNTQTVTSVITVNDQQISVTTTHSSSSLAVAEGATQAAGFSIIFHGVCNNATCTMYYSSLEVYKDNKLIIQEGVRKVFTDASLDTFVWLTPEARIPFVGNGKVLVAADLTNASLMVGKLNGKEAVKSTSGTRF